MLKKLNGNITKLLFYIKNNLVSCVFKFSILSTMLVLLYLVCMLSQTDSVSSSDNSNVYPMENSQKLMLTIPTEIPKDDFNSYYASTEVLETLYSNSLSKSKNDEMYIGTHPLFPIQEPTTTQITAIDERTDFMQELHPEVTIVNTPDQILPELMITTTSAQEIDTESSTLNSETTTEAGISSSSSLVSTINVGTTTESIIYSSESQETTTIEAIIVNPASATSAPTVSTPVSVDQVTAIPEHIDPAPTIPAATVLASAVPIKRSLSPEELKMFSTRESTTEVEPNTTTTNNLLEEPIEENDDLTTNLLTSSHPHDSVDLDQVTSTAPAINIPLPVSEDDLFMDNWANNLSAENPDIQHELIDEASIHLKPMGEPTESFFQNDDFEPTASIELPILNNESNISCEENHTIKSDIEQVTKKEIDHNQDYNVEEPYRIFSPQNLLNLFAFDHQSSPSHAKANWWPKSKSSQMSVLAENAANNHRKRSNRILSNEDSQEISGRMFNQRNQFPGFDNLLNTKLKNSVSILDKLFGKFLR